MAVNLSLFAGAGAQFFDDNGVPLAGGLIYTYAAGTTTPAVTYTSNLGLTAHANPIVLNAAGRVATGEIWVTVGSAYKFILKNSTGVQIGSYDNIPSYLNMDSANVTYNEGGTGAVTTTVQAKLQETVNINDFGGDPTGVLDSTNALQLACAQRNEVHITNGTYKISTTPTITGPTNIIVHSSATLTGAGATALGYTSSTILQILNVKTSGTDYASEYIRRIANHTGGAVGYVSSGLRVDSYVNAAATNYEWAITALMDNSATAGENTAIYAQGIKRSTGPTWGTTVEVIETTAVNNPTTGTVAQELDISVNGTDANYPFARIGSDLVVRKYNAAGVSAQAGWGYRIQGDAGASIQIGFGIYTGMTATFGFDTSQGTILIAALRMATGQAIAFDAAADNKLAYDGTGLNYIVSGTGKVRLNSNGSILLVGAVNQLNIKPDTSSGSAAVTLGANKPGSTTGATSRWIQVDIDNTIYWVPAWLN